MDDESKLLWGLSTVRVGMKVGWEPIYYGVDDMREILSSEETPWLFKHPSCRIDQVDSHVVVRGRDEIM